MIDQADTPTEMAPSTREETAPTMVAGRSEPPRSFPTLAGSVLAERYEIVDLLGRGGMGEVYRARDRELDEIVALKVLRPELAARADVVERFRNEVKLARRVTHRAVARTFELGTAGGLRFITMEFVDGEPLSRVLARRGPLEPAWCVRIAAEVCDALVAAHEAGIVHRDIKPDNVMLTGDGRAVVTDFGVARLASDGTSDLAGTPAYMAPEQVRDRPPTARSDLYALGVTLYEALTGALPFMADSHLASLAMRVGRPPPDLRALRPDVPAALAEVVRTAMAEDPDARFASASTMRSALLASVVLRSMPPAALGIERRATEPRPWTTIEVRPPHDVPVAVRHLTGALVDEMTLLLGGVAHLRLALEEDGDADLVVRCAVDDRGDRVIVDAVWSATGEVLWTGRASIVAGRVTPAAETFARSIALAVDAPDPVPVPVTWPADAALDLMFRGRLLFHGRFHDELREAQVLLGDAILREATRTGVPNGVVSAGGTSGAPDAAAIDRVGSAPLLATFAMASLRQAFFVTDDAAPMDLAERAARRARELSPRRPEVHLATGHLALHRGDPVAAARSFREAIRLAPAWPGAHEWLGRMLLEAGFLADGARRARCAVRLDPGLGALRWEIARAHALEGAWPLVDLELAQVAASSDGLRGRWLSRLRWSAWRGGVDGVRETLEAMEHAPPEELFEPVVCKLFAESVLDGAYARWVPLVRERMLSSVGGSARRRAVGLQVVAEAAFASGCIEEGLDVVARSVDVGLFDLHWLDRCTLLAPARDEPRFAALRAVVATRANAIVDALFGE